MTLEELAIKISAIATDVKWLVREKRDSNGEFREHIKESDKFRRRVTRNTVWRIAYHFGFIIVFGIIGFMAWHLFR